MSNAKRQATLSFGKAGTLSLKREVPEAPQGETAAKRKKAILCDNQQKASSNAGGNSLNEVRTVDPTSIHRDVGRPSTASPFRLSASPLHGGRRILLPRCA
jgi:hypothetical protein